MGVRGALARLAARAPVPVFVLVGEGGREAAWSLRLDPRVEVVDSPRHAAVLLLAGGLTRALLGPALRVHDQVPPPRAVVWWPLDAAAAELVVAFPAVREDAPGEDVGEVVVALHRGLLGGSVPGAPPALLDIDPAPWRGVGPFGHGGKGMTGGVPYGRPLAVRALDRDGLELDQLRLRLGPFLPAFPPGLVLDVALQGDVVQEVSLGPNPFTRWPGDPAPAWPATDPFHRALRHPVAVGELEEARARHHLRWAADILRLLGLSALGRRALAAAHGIGRSRAATAAARRLAVQLAAHPALRWPMAGVGTVGRSEVAGRRLGPVARAAGCPEDTRELDPGYTALGFRQLTMGLGDAWSRFRQRLGEAVQALDLAERAGERRTTPMELAESPRGPITAASPAPSAVLLPELSRLLVGLEWGDAVVTIASLDLDMEEAALAGEGEANRGQPGAGQIVGARTEQSGGAAG